MGLSPLQNKLAVDHWVSSERPSGAALIELLLNSCDKLSRYLLPNYLIDKLVIEKILSC